MKRRSVIDALIAVMANPALAVPLQSGPTVHPPGARVLANGNIYFPAGRYIIERRA